MNFPSINELNESDYEESSNIDCNDIYLVEKKMNHFNAYFNDSKLDKKDFSPENSRIIELNSNSEEEIGG
jgi:hypothetical protein